MPQLLFLELNEIIFPYLEKYIARGHLPTFAKLFRQYGYVETQSEEKFSEIEPWIQWVSIHTGKTFKNHGVFRLGDIIGREHLQIWEHLEQQGCRVGAISPMNAENRLKNACFFMPDPWTETLGSGSFLFLRLYEAIKQTVNDNAQKQMTLRSVIYLTLGWLWYSRMSSLPSYARAFLQALRGHRWAQAVFLDRFLGDIFLKLSRKTRPNYASLFLNAAAHIQHHYLYSSRAYEGGHENPEWYMARHIDPLLEAYRVYDEVVGNALEMPNAPRIMIATGLKQEPHGKITFFYRFKDHQAFFRKLGVEFVKINTLMSRDFVMEFDSTEKAVLTAQILLEATDLNGTKLFTVDNRGSSLFVELVYSTEIKPGLSVKIADQTVSDFHQHVAFVAIRNGQHNGSGYFLDTGNRAEGKATELPVSDIWSRVDTAVLG